MRLDNAPYQREVIDMTADPRCNRISLMWGAQVGKTQTALAAQAFRINRSIWARVSGPARALFRRWSKSGGRRILARAMRPTIPTASGLRHELWSRKERTGARGYCAFRCRDRIGPGRGASEGQFRGRE
ncbi:phage terminase large subunit family protein [Rhodobacteraceae bacterium G21628-S1]|nr:phage terminase large subunit family protein [Rhodobacteraceae bacterium G21628-S1]